MPKSKSKERQAELNRHRDILLATVDYILQQVETEGLSRSDLENVAGHLKQEKLQVDKYFEMGRLDVLQRKLRNLTLFPMRKVDFDFSEYIKIKTGYVIDIFETLERRVNEIIAQNRIINEKQIGDIMIMLEVYRRKVVDVDKSEILKNLLIDYSNKKIVGKNLQ
jgi:hypothetical protein